MGILGLFSRSASNIISLLYPSYASYKAFTTRSGPSTERWLVYWTVLGSLMAAEGVLGWLVGWVPFYQEMRLLFVIWMVLPQSEGSTYVYQYFLSPFFNEHERDVDAMLGDMRYKVGGLLGKMIGWAWDRLRENLNLPNFPSGQQVPSGLTGTIPAQVNEWVNQNGHQQNQQQPQQQYPIPPSLHAHPPTPDGGAVRPGFPQQSSSSSSALSYASSLFTHYAPIAVAAASSRLASTPAPGGPRDRSVSGPASMGVQSTTTFEARQTQSQFASTTNNNLSTPPHTQSTFAGSSSMTMQTARQQMSAGEIRQRRAQLEAELAALASPNPTPRSVSPAGSGASRASGGYDEIRMEEVVTGEVDAGEGNMAGVGARGSWFGWGSPTGKAGYSGIPSHEKTE